LNTPSKTGNNIVFIGDSVPFGWGVEGSSTVPSKLHKLFSEEGKNIGIINAAVPSYSLDQAVHRYKNEIAGKFHALATIIQIYDPASQFAGLGPDWDVTKNWTTRWKKPERSSDKVSDRIFIFRYSAIYYICSYIYRMIHAFEKYSDSITISLGTLYQEREDDERILVLPVTIPKKSWEKSSLMRKMSIYMLNRTMKNYAQKHNSVTYLDTINLFEDEADKNVFIDSCCHLSEYGATLQAKFIANNLHL